MIHLKTAGMSKSFGGIKAVNRLSVAFAPGKITGLIGPNGSGKSTLINLLTGFLPCDSGFVFVGERIKLAGIRPHQAAPLGITRTFQETRLFDQMSVLDNVLVALTERSVWRSIFDATKERHLQAARTELERVGLWEKRLDPAAGLSYGQRKLLEVARALALGADVYLFDEPFAGLFPSMTETLSAILNYLRNRGKTVVLVEHDLDLIRKLSDRCVVMDAGQVLAEGTPDEVLARRDVINAYLGN